MKRSFPNDSTAPSTSNELDFDLVLFQSIDEAMSVLGGPGKQAVYFYLDKSFKLKKEDLAVRVDDFSFSLEKIFGIGANFIYDLILKIVSQKISMDYALLDINKHSFTVCISIARENSNNRKVAAR